MLGAVYVGVRRRLVVATRRPRMGPAVGASRTKAALEVRGFGVSEWVLPFGLFPLGLILVSEGECLLEGFVYQPALYTGNRV
jgi:hypothetical protein